MRKKLKKFLNNHSLTIAVYTSLACIAIWDSIIALVIYSIIIHIVLLLLIMGLYQPDIVSKPPTIKLSAKKILLAIVRISTFTIILVMTKHWYILCASLSCVFLALIYLYNWIKVTPPK